MPTAEKERVIIQATEWCERSEGIVFADYKGIGVKELQKLRSDVRSKGGEFHVIKNTLFRRAFGENTNALPDDFHNGTTAFTFVFENERDVAKALVDFAKTSKKLTLKGGFFNGKAYSASQIESLSALPPRDVLIAQVIGAIAAPLSTLVGTIEAIYAEPIRTVYAVAKKAADDSGASE